MPLREEPVGDAEQIRLARADDVLRLDALAALRGARGAKVITFGHAVDAGEAAVAAAAKAGRSARAVELRAPGDDALVGGKERHRDRLAAFGDDLGAVERELHRVAERAHVCPRTWAARRYHERASRMPRHGLHSSSTMRLGILGPPV